MSVFLDPGSPAEQLQNLSAEVLFSLARNDSGRPEFRKAAVELLMDGGYPQASSPELLLMVDAIKREREARGEVKAIVESAIEAPIPAGPLRASVTTKTLSQPEIFRNPRQLGEDALAGE